MHACYARALQVMDGVEATRTIRDLERQRASLSASPASGGSVDRIPIIALSAVAEEESIKAFRDAGVCDVMSKPVAGAMLIAAINRCTSIEARAR